MAVALRLTDPALKSMVVTPVGDLKIQGKYHPPDVATRVTFTTPDGDFLFPDSAGYCGNQRPVFQSIGGNYYHIPGRLAVIISQVIYIIEKPEADPMDDVVLIKLSDVPLPASTPAEVAPSNDQPIANPCIPGSQPESTELSPPSIPMPDPPLPRRRRPATSRRLPRRSTPNRPKKRRVVTQVHHLHEGSNVATHLSIPSLQPDFLRCVDCNAPTAKRLCASASVRPPSLRVML